MTTLLSPPATILFNNHLNQFAIVDARAGGSYMLHAVQTQMNLGLGLVEPATGLPLLTTVWAYELVSTTGTVIETGHVHGTGPDAIYNPTFLVSSGVPISMSWMNMLPMSGHILPVDASIMDMMGMGDSTPMDANMVPIVVHLHGAHTASIYDGYPTVTITQMDMSTGGGMSGGGTGSVLNYTYDNSQGGAMLWYHDHSMGFTRLNVFAGLAGTYLIEDQNHRDLVAANVLPDYLSPDHISLMIADRSFTSDGQLYFPGASADDPLPGGAGIVGDVLPPDYVALGGTFPTAVPEYYGDFIMVNGQAWPHAHVSQGQMQFDLVNGSDSRFFTLVVDNPWVKVTLLGTDGGLLQHAITVMDGDGVQEAGEQIVFSPADRLQLMFDFSDPHIAAGDKIHLLNIGAAYEPFKGLNPDGTLKAGVGDNGEDLPVMAATPADAAGNILEFRVNGALPAHHYNIDETTLLNPNYTPIDPATADASASVNRKLGVFETVDQFGRIMPMVGTAEAKTDYLGNEHLGGLGFVEPVTELVQLGATETWEFYNTTADAHPIHMHLGQFQVIGRYHISDTDTNGDGVIIDGYNNDLGDLIDTRADLDGNQNLYPEDTGLQDTVWVGPGEALKVIMTFDRPGDYVWHCHILSHEDHDMMRPFKVLGIQGDFTGAIGEDSTLPSLGLIEIGTADPYKQGFQAGTFSGRYGSLTLQNNLTFSDGTASANGNNGEWSYSVDGRAQALAQGETLSDVITITELDGVTQHQITVAVQGTNDAPIISAPVTLAAGTQNVTRTITAAEFLANASDVDHGAVLSVSGLTASAGTLVDNGDGSWDLIPVLNATAPVTFSYSVSDGMTSVAATATLAVQPGLPFAVLTGTALVNNLKGGALNDYIDALAGNDELKGNAGDDVLIGGAGNDQAQGGAGNDRFVATKGDGNDDYLGGAGIDTYDMSQTAAAATVNLTTGRSASAETGSDSLNEIENVTGGSGNDWITGDSLSNLLIGRQGNDTLSGMAGNDRLAGGAGSDILIGGLGNDSFIFRNTFGHDTISDFAVGTAAAHDTIDVMGLGFTSVADVLAHTDQAGANAIIHAGANDIVLSNVLKTALQAWDFAV